LHFDLIDTYVSPDSIVVFYQNERGAKIREYLRSTTRARSGRVRPIIWRINDEAVIARSTCDEAIHLAALRKNGLLRFARNDDGGQSAFTTSTTGHSCT
jgi:hypothetical protein